MHSMLMHCCLKVSKASINTFLSARFISLSMHCFLERTDAFFIFIFKRTDKKTSAKVEGPLLSTSIINRKGINLLDRFCKNLYTKVFSL